VKSRLRKVAPGWDGGGVIEPIKVNEESGKAREEKKEDIVEQKEMTEEERIMKELVDGLERLDKS
jgi:hypothetical protein